MRRLNGKNRPLERRSAPPHAALKPLLCNPPRRVPSQACFIRNCHISLQEECTALRNHSTRPVIATQGFGVTDTNGPLSMEVTEESELAQLKQLQALTRSQQRQILEHQEALASLHAMIRETQEAQVGALRSFPCDFLSVDAWLRCANHGQRQCTGLHGSPLSLTHPASYATFCSATGPDALCWAGGSPTAKGVLLGILVFQLPVKALQCAAILAGRQSHTSPCSYAQRSATLHLLCLGRLNQQGRAAGHLDPCAAHGSAAAHRRAEHNLQRRCQTDAAGPGRLTGSMAASAGCAAA